MYTKEMKRNTNNKNEAKRNEIRGREFNANEAHKKKHKYSLSIVRMTGASVDVGYIGSEKLMDFFLRLCSMRQTQQQQQCKHQQRAR